MMTKHIFTPEMDALIMKTYRVHGTGNGQVKKLADAFGMPRWAVQHRAVTIEAYEPKVKEPEWSEKEIKILGRNAHKHIEVIRRHLKKNGFVRSSTAILLKRKRLRLPGNLPGYSGRQLAMGFGVDSHVIIKYIQKSWLKAEKRGTDRTERQGGDIWFIRDKHVRNFIIESIGVIDIRKVDKVWFVDILANGRI